MTFDPNGPHRLSPSGPFLTPGGGSGHIIQVNGVSFPLQPVLNFIDGDNSVFVGANNPGNNSTDIRVNVTSAEPSGPAGGDLSADFPNPEVVAFQETSGPTRLAFGGFADMSVGFRFGATFIGSSILIVDAGASFDLVGGDVLNTHLATSDGEHDIGNVAGPNLTIDANNGSFQELTLTGDVTAVTMTPPSAGIARVQVYFQQDGVGGHSIVGWPANVLWVDGGTPPTFTSAPDALDIVTFTFRSNGDITAVFAPNFL